MEPRAPNQPLEGENPFTLPSARGAGLPPAPVPEKEAPARKEPSPAKPLPAPPAKEGLGARLFRSFRAEPAPPPAETKPETPEIVFEEPERRGFSLPPARLVEASEEPSASGPDRREAPPVATPPRAEPPGDADEPSVLDLDAEPAEPPAAAVEPETPPPAARRAPPPAADAPQPPPPQAPPAAAPEEPLLPSSAHDETAPVRPRPSRPEPRPRAPETQTPQPAGAAGSRNSLVMIAAIAGAALGTVSVLAVYLLMRPDTTPGASQTVASPFARANPSPAAPPAAAPAAPPQQSPPPLLEAPPPAPAPAPVAARPAVVPPPPPAQTPAAAAPAFDPSRPAASFGAAPHTILADETAPAVKPKPAAPPPAARPRRRAEGPRWTFEGMVFDLLTARGVYGAHLVFVNAEGDVVGETDSGPAGRYRITIPAGEGYKLKVAQSDYTDRYIDEGDATSSLREATPEERRILMSAAARNLPWTGDPKKATHRDLALVPRTPEEP
ncbi:MAG TPA: hypothetical protein VH309_07565 [Elusimicrobiota bacterium]|jgi:hypothetical protein|nr:hypothetical protein [Elusimicrobiota bacterium]